jgi:hypothetical protein
MSTALLSEANSSASLSRRTFALAQETSAVSTSPNASSTDLRFRGIIENNFDGNALDHLHEISSLVIGNHAFVSRYPSSRFAR